MIRRELCKKLKFSNIPIIKRTCEIDIGNPKTRKTLRLLSSGTKLFITFELKVIRREEKETQSFYADFSICPKPTCGARPQTTGLASTSPESQPSSSEVGTQLTFLQIPPNPQRFRAWRHSPPSVTIPIWEFLFWHLLMTPNPRAWIPALMLHLSNPCTKRKVLILTKPKGKIYKTRSHRNYITIWPYYEMAYAQTRTRPWKWES